MSKQINWIMFTPERDGIVRLNVVETTGAPPDELVLQAVDVSRPLSSYSQDIQDLILDTFGTLAAEESATPAPVTRKQEDVEAEERALEAEARQ